MSFAVVSEKSVKRDEAEGHNGAQGKGSVKAGTQRHQVVIQLSHAEAEKPCPPLGEGTFAYFCCRAKVWRLAGRDPPVLPFISNIRIKLKTAGPGRQPGGFLCRSKESHQRKDLRCAGHLCLQGFGALADGCVDFQNCAAWRRDQGGLCYRPPRS